MDERGQVTAEEEPGYGIGAVARRLGVPAPTLRTWNLRYGIGPSRRSPGGHRRYDAGDLRRLEEMNRLIRAGMPAADAAREVLRAAVVPVEGRAGAPASVPPGRTDRVAERAGGGPMPVPPGRTDRHALPPFPPDPGRETFPPAPAETRPEIPTAAMLARAAVALDSQAVADWIGAALARHGVMWTWENLVLPVFETICRRQAETGASIEVEHLFSDRVLAALTRLVERPARPVNERPVLLACAEDEQHSLPVYALAAVLTTDHHVETRVLGARTPYPALADAMRRLGPAAVFVWSQISATGDPAPLASLPLLRPASRVIAGGGGWWEGLPPSVPHVTSFRDALTRISAALH
ncbi:MerR family transcriptional regulator [Streptosporangium roseum]|uniref:Transcriptional regulator, MerR family n=1 Tax=Streptosporangium roseum (strain ATCC 12428 / DSM 43021 / JCM 3005 / KCTC 9067 / NCIMB 10171 / NRRL 2505 / NI 9100) TaxID=479432 RepID=D2ARS5_STRRD|nr:MerR family transcriptional regulator [Streptosporangium roseum]ACZ84604.1 putative transcriptional regulator, MerR family [Streptosporangium roseum DSM 43021]